MFLLTRMILGPQRSLMSWLRMRRAIMSLSSFTPATTIPSFLQGIPRVCPFHPEVMAPSLTPNCVSAVVIQNTTFGGIQGFSRKPSTPWTDDNGRVAGLVHQERDWTYVLLNNSGNLFPEPNRRLVSQLHFFFYHPLIPYSRPR